MQPMVLRRPALAVLGALALFAGSAAQAFESKPYDAASFKAAQAAGKPVIVHVTAPWCPTCKAQEQAIDGLSKKAEYSTLTLFKVDFDTQEAVMKSFNARTQSTIIAFNGRDETGRIVGQTSSDAVNAVFATTVK